VGDRLKSPGTRNRVNCQNGRELAARNEKKLIRTWTAGSPVNERRGAATRTGRHPLDPQAEVGAASTRFLSAPLVRVWLASLVRRENRRRPTQRSHTARPDPSSSSPLLPYAPARPPWAVLTNSRAHVEVLR
jgi:hypothetical protein